MRHRSRGLRVLTFVAVTGAIAVTLTALDRRNQAAAQAQVEMGQPLTYERAQQFVEARRQRLDYLPGEVVVKFKKGTSEASQQRALDVLRSRPTVGQLRRRGDAAVLRDPSQPNARILAQQLSEQPEVLYAEPNYLYSLPVERSDVSRALSKASARTMAFTPNDPDFSQLQWNLSAAILDMPRAWDLNQGGNPELLVAVVDTGVTMFPHTRVAAVSVGGVIQNVTLNFAPSPELIPSRFGAAADFEPLFSNAPLIDFDSHGTHVASTIAETTNNGVALAGVAFNVRIMPVKVCDSFWEVEFALAAAGDPVRPPSDVGGCNNADIAAGIIFAADNGAKVINISLGGPGQSLTIRNALNYAVSRGAFIAVSMGNSFDEGNETEFPAGFAPAIDGVMSVAAIGRSKNHAFYSSAGPHCEIAAPGGDSRDGGILGEVWQVTMSQSAVSPFASIPAFNVYAEVPFQGTSMASPHVAGIAALIMSQNPGISPATVEALIKSSALDLGTPGRDDQFGFGLIQPRKALRGFGIAR